MHRHTPPRETGREGEERERARARARARERESERARGREGERARGARERGSERAPAREITVSWRMTHVHSGHTLNAVPNHRRSLSVRVIASDCVSVYVSSAYSVGHIMMI